jgi:hypothetical protein
MRPAPVGQPQVLQDGEESQWEQLQKQAAALATLVAKG